MPPWETGKQSMISFKFRTNEPNGLILLTTNTKSGNVSPFNLYDNISFSCHSNELYNNKKNRTKLKSQLKLPFLLVHNSLIYLLWNCLMDTFTYMSIWERVRLKCVLHVDVSMKAIGMNWHYVVPDVNAKYQLMDNGMIFEHPVMQQHLNWIHQFMLAELGLVLVQLIGHQLCGQLH